MDSSNIPANKLDDLKDLSEYLEFLSCGSENSELCHPGLHQAIKKASVAAKNLAEAEKDP